MSHRLPAGLLMAQSDERLVALTRDGNEAAFEALVRRYRRPLLRYCGRLRLSESRAEDILQQAFLQAWLALVERGVEVRDPRSWLYRIVHNVAVNAMRRASAERGALAEVSHTASMFAAAAADLDAGMEARQALSEVAALPELQREAIFLTALGGRSHGEVATALGISHGAVRGLLYRARITLRSAAAAITPQWLIVRSGSGGGGAPTSERMAELTAGGGAVGVTGMIAKGAAIVVTAGVLAAGPVVVSRPSHAARRTDRPARSIVTPEVGARHASASVSAVPAQADYPVESGRSGDRAGTRRDTRGDRGDRHAGESSGGPATTDGSRTGDARAEPTTSASNLSSGAGPGPRRAGSAGEAAPPTHDQTVSSSGEGSGADGSDGRVDGAGGGQDDRARGGDSSGGPGGQSDATATP